MCLKSSILLLLPGCGCGCGGCGGAVTVTGDCCYGPRKSSVPVMKISKRIKERKKKHLGLEMQMRLESFGAFFSFFFFFFLLIFITDTLIRHHNQHPAVATTAVAATTAGAVAASTATIAGAGAAVPTSWLLSRLRGHRVIAIAAIIPSSQCLSQ